MFVSNEEEIMYGIVEDFEIQTSTVFAYISPLQIVDTITPHLYECEFLRYIVISQLKGFSFMYSYILI